MAAEIRYPQWLASPPDRSVDHRYLTNSEIDDLPCGIYYKRKSVLTRERFIKAKISGDRGARIIEVIDNRGHWRISLADAAWICAMADAHFPLPVEEDLNDFGTVDEATRQIIVALRILGFPCSVLPDTVSLPAGRVQLPVTSAQIRALYADYTDMEEQGHFDEDSPDLERMDLMLSWTPTGARVLDLGCNSGTFAMRLARDDCTVVGLDLSLSLLRKSLAKGVPAVQAFAEALPFRDQVFDTVLCGELLEHVLAPEHVVEESMRVLRPGGLLVGTVPHSEGAWGIEDMGHHEEHLRAYDPQALDRLFRAGGFIPGRMVAQHFGSPKPQGLAFTYIKPA